jgi:hypothetical protein
VKVGEQVVSVNLKLEISLLLPAACKNNMFYKILGLKTAFMKLRNRIVCKFAQMFAKWSA